MGKEIDWTAAWERAEEGVQAFMSPKGWSDVNIVRTPGLEKGTLTLEHGYHISGPEDSKGGAADQLVVVFEDKTLPSPLRRFFIEEAGSLSAALQLAAQIAQAGRIWGLSAARADIERLPAIHEVDWMVDNVPLQYLPAMTKELLRHAIQSCWSADIHGLIEFLGDWQSTAEELIVDREELEEVLSARQEVREGGYSLERRKEGLIRLISESSGGYQRTKNRTILGK